MLLRGDTGRTDYDIFHELARPSRPKLGDDSDIFHHGIAQVHARRPSAWR